MAIFSVGSQVHIQIIEGQISIYEHETELSVRVGIGTIVRQIPLMEFDEETCARYPYLPKAEAYEVDVDGKMYGALGWPPTEGGDYDVSEGLMYIAIHTHQIPSLIQGRVETE